MNIVVKNQSLSLRAKLIILAIPVIIFTYLIAVNFLIAQEFNYFYDIGGTEDSVKHYISPSNRTSEINYTSDISYRDVTNRLTYLNIPFTKGSTNLSVNLRFRSNINTPLNLGVKNNTGWNYTWYLVNESLEYSGEWNEISYTAPLDLAYPENDKLSLSFDIYGISRAGYRNNSFFSIDWINLTVYKPGVFG